MKKQNCWEFLKCGREPKGINAAKLGICPASLPGESDSANNGKNRGRICWDITGTLCDGKVQGTFAQKRDTCLNCDFFTKVRQEEGKDFCLMMAGSKMLKIA